MRDRHRLGAVTVSMIGTMALWGAMVMGRAQTASKQPEVITLTQTGCQFLEPEAKNHHFATQSPEDCEAINQRTGSQRLEAVKPLTLKPGRYIFRVTNKNVPYELGFYLRGAGLGRLTLPKVSGGGLVEGKTQDYAVELTAGEYYFSCPLNPTPDYPVVVKK